MKKIGEQTRNRDSKIKIVEQREQRGRDEVMNQKKYSQGVQLQKGHVHMSCKQQQRVKRKNCLRLMCIWAVACSCKAVEIKIGSSSCAELQWDSRGKKNLSRSWAHQLQWERSAEKRIEAVDVHMTYELESSGKKKLASHVHINCSKRQLHVKKIGAPDVHMTCSERPMERKKAHTGHVHIRCTEIEV